MRPKLVCSTLTDDIDKDFCVNEWHRTNVFIRDDAHVFRTYFINSRGDEQMGKKMRCLTSARCEPRFNNNGTAE